MKRLRTVTILATTLAVVTVSACAPLRPVDRPDVMTPAPAVAPLWQALAEVRGDDWQQLLDNGPRALDLRLFAIDSATESIDLQTFLWSPDTVGSLVLDHLIAAADRGVTVRILVDDSFLVDQDDVVLAVHRHPNIEYRIFNPYQRRAGGLAARQFLNAAEFHRVDHRMHNKAMVIDNRVAIVGGRNLADEYFGIHAEENFRDVELLVAGPVVGDISAEFDRYFNDVWSFPIDELAHVAASPADLAHARHIRETHRHLHSEQTPEQRRERWLSLARTAVAGRVTLYADDPPGPDPASPESRPDQVADELIRIFDGARRELVIVSAYLIPTPEVEGAVARAVDRGVAVRILTNSIQSNNHLAAHSAYRRHVGTLIDAGARLHEVRIDARDRSRHMLTPVEEKVLALHAKALVIDHDRVFVGSTNLDPRSLRINTEMGLLVESRELNAQLRAALDPDFLPENAWELRRREDGRIVWVSDDRTLDIQPAASFMQRLEDWFFSLLPIEGEL